MKKVRKIELKKFKVNKEKLDKVMENLKKMFGKIEMEDCEKVHIKEGDCYRSMEDLLSDLEDEDENYDVDEVIGDLIEENQQLKVRVCNLEDDMRKAKKVLRTLMETIMPKKWECKFQYKKEKDNKTKNG